MAEVNRRGFGYKVWVAVEAAQGHAFVSDAIEEMTDAQALKIARGALKQARKVVRILNDLVEREERRVWKEVSGS